MMRLPAGRWFLIVPLLCFWGARTGSAVTLAIPPNAADAGGSVDMCVLMSGSQGSKVAGVQMNLRWDGTCVSLIGCNANPQTGKTLSTRVAGQNCGADQNCLIALLLSTTDVEPIPDGIPLLCCSFVVSDTPPNSTCPFSLSNAIASDPTGGRVSNLSAQGGVLSVRSAPGSAGQPALPVVPAAPVVNAPAAQAVAPPVQPPAGGGAQGRPAGSAPPAPALPAEQAPEGGGAIAEPTSATGVPTVAAARTDTPKRTAAARTPTPRPEVTKAATAAQSPGTGRTTPGATTPTPGKQG